MQRFFFPDWSLFFQYWKYCYNTNHNTYILLNILFYNYEWHWQICPLAPPRQDWSHKYHGTKGLVGLGGREGEELFCPSHLPRPLVWCLISEGMRRKNMLSLHWRGHSHLPSASREWPKKLRAVHWKQLRALLPPSGSMCHWGSRKCREAGGWLRHVTANLRTQSWEWEPITKEYVNEESYK